MSYVWVMLCVGVGQPALLPHLVRCFPHLDTTHTLNTERIEPPCLSLTLTPSSHIYQPTNTNMVTRFTMHSLRSPTQGRQVHAAEAGVPGGCAGTGAMSVCVCVGHECVERDGGVWHVGT